MERQNIRTSWLLAALVLLVAGQGMSQPADDLDRRVRQAKEAYGFANWSPETGRVISGVVLSEKTIPEAAPLREVWKDGDYSVQRDAPYPRATIHKLWRLEGNELDVTMAVTTTHDAAKEYLISSYAYTERAPLLIRPSGRRFGVNTGNVCFVITEDEGKTFSSIDFIRDNVVITMRARGNGRQQLKGIAERLDGLLLKKRPAKEYARLPDLPRITALSPRETTVKLGATVPLRLQVRDPSESGTRYFWAITGGGVRRDLVEEFVYQATETGKQRITITVVNGVGLYASKSVDVEVVP